MAFPNQRIRQFFFPSLTAGFLLRAGCVALFACLFFSQVLIPLHIKGSSMEPTYRNGSFNFCFRWRYLFSSPRRDDVVAVRLAGKKVMLLKRVVALGGEQVEFRNGKLFVEGKKMDEPYVRYPCDWDLSPRRVEKDGVYVIGDNRSMPIENHHFGQVSTKRIMGAVLW